MQPPDMCSKVFNSSCKYFNNVCYQENASSALVSSSNASLLSKMLLPFAVLVSSGAAIFSKTHSLRGRAKQKEQIDESLDTVVTRQHIKKAPIGPVNSQDTQVKKQTISTATGSAAIPQAKKNTAIPVQIDDIIPIYNNKYELLKIDVPGDGNCLFYSIALALKFRSIPGPYKNIDAWALVPTDASQKNQFKGDGSAVDRKKVLRAGQELRDTALNWLQENRSCPEVHIALLSAVTDTEARTSLDPILDRKYDKLVAEKWQAIDQLKYGDHYQDYLNAKMTLNLLQKDHFALKKFIQNGDLSKIVDLENVNQQIAHQKQLISIDLKQSFTDDLKKYLSTLEQEMDSIILARDKEKINLYLTQSAEQDFFCGTAQILALSHVYNIPISVIYGDGQTRTFNEKPGQSPIIIAHVGGNHFNFVYPNKLSSPTSLSEKKTFEECLEIVQKKGSIETIPHQMQKALLAHFIKMITLQEASNKHVGVIIPSYRGEKLLQSYKEAANLLKASISIS